jgi:UV DNA damage endonuclease
MRVGYPCINWIIGCKSDRTFRLRSYSENRLKQTVRNNLDCLCKTLDFNVKNNLLFFRITSDLVPFASHPICRFNWQKHFEKEFSEIGENVKTHNVRISMHPDQFTVINSPDDKVFENSCKELAYHTSVLDMMGLDVSEKIQIHVGGVYKDKEKSMRRFVERFDNLEETLARRLVIENDDRLYSLKDCLRISERATIPVLFDVFHHEINSSGETLKEAFTLFTRTWNKKDGIPMVDYSSPSNCGTPRKHAESIDLRHFELFLKETMPFDFDVMLEIKDKEKSAMKAEQVAFRDQRLSELRAAK